MVRSAILEEGENVALALVFRTVSNSFNVFSFHQQGGVYLNRR